VNAIRRLSVLALALAAALAGTASAYVLDTDGNGNFLHWPKRTVSYRLVAGNVPGGAAGENAVHNAFNSWSAVSSNLNYRFDGFVSSGAQAYDNRNLVYWIQSGWPYDPTLLAITFRYFDRSNGRLLDADIVFNAQRYTWTVGGSGYDIENSAAHEVGHFSGLGHSSHGEATMYGSARPGETKKRALHADDISGLTALYGGGSGSAAGGGVVAAGSTGVDGSGGSGGGGCSIGSVDAPGDATNLLWIATLLAGLALRRLRPGPSPGADCVGAPALTGFGGGLEGAAVPGPCRGGGGVQHERGARQAVRSPCLHDRVLGPGV
jgi:hypothetical protein